MLTETIFEGLYDWRSFSHTSAVMPVSRTPAWDVTCACHTWKPRHKARPWQEVWPGSEPDWWTNKRSDSHSFPKGSQLLCSGYAVGDFQNACIEGIDRRICQFFAAAYSCDLKFLGVWDLYLPSSGCEL